MKYQYTYEIVETIEKAQALCESINNKLSRYMKANKPAHFTPWNSQDGLFNGYVVLYWR